MFDGSLGKKRHRYGSRKSKTQLLQDAKREREKRQHEREREAAAVKLQRFVRRNVRRLLMQRALRSTWDGELEDADTMAELLTCIKRITLFFNVDDAGDVARLHRVCTVVIKSMSNQAPASSFAELLLDDGTADECAEQLYLLLRACVRVMSAAALGRDGVQRADWAWAINTLRVVTNVGMWKCASTPERVGAARLVIARLLCRLATSSTAAHGGLYCALRDGMFHSTEVADEVGESDARQDARGWLDAVVDAAMRPFHYLDVIDRVLARQPSLHHPCGAFAVYFLSQPLFSHRLPLKLLAKMSPALPYWSQMLARLPNLLHPGRAPAAWLAALHAPAALNSVSAPSAKEEKEAPVAWSLRSMPRWSTHMDAGADSGSGSGSTSGSGGDVMDTGGSPLPPARGPQTGAWLLGNIVEFQAAVFDRTTSTQLCDYSNSLACLLPYDPLCSYQLDHELVSSDDEDDDEGSARNAQFAAALAAGKTHARLVHQMETLSKAANLRRMLATVLSFDGTVSARSVVTVVHLYNNLSVQATTPLALLRSLSITAHLISEYWMMIKTHINLEALVAPGPPLCLPSLAATDEEVYSVTSLFFEMFYHYLFVLSDQHFFSHPTFTLRDAKLVVLVTKTLVHRLVMETRELTPIERHLMRVSGKLFERLHDRHTRRGFCEDATWRLPLPPGFSEQACEEDSREAQLLTIIPHSVSFAHRVAVFMKGCKETGASVDITVRRDHLVEDAFSSLRGEALRGRVRVSFVDEHGLNEAGIDGGGLYKEFMVELCKQAFNPEYGLFMSTASNHIYPNPASHLMHSDDADYYAFLGRVLGKLLQSHLLVELPFARFFLNKMLHRANVLDDLASLDADLHRNLMMLMEYEGDVQDLGLTFSITDKSLGVVRETNLVPKGADVPVTNESKVAYMLKVADYRLNKQIHRQATSFLRGFNEVVEADRLHMFNADEMGRLIGGDSVPLDVADLCANVRYQNCTAEDTQIVWFWEIMHSWPDRKRRKMLQFVTSSERSPLLGFRMLSPAVTVYLTDPNPNDPDTLTRLPSAATCMHQLRLARYESKAIMERQLNVALENAHGFQLS